MKVRGDLVSAWATAGDAVLGAAVLTGAGAFAGLWLDEKLNSSPWLAITLSILGMTLGLTRMVRKALAADQMSSTAKQGPPEADKSVRVSDNSQQAEDDSEGWT